MPVVTQTAKQFFACRSSYEMHIEARTSATSGYHRTRKRMLAEGAIDEKEFAASIEPISEKEWVEQQGSLEGPIVMVATAGTKRVLSNAIGDDGAVLEVEEDVEYDDRTSMRTRLGWSEISEFEYNTFLEGARP